MPLPSPLDIPRSHLMELCFLTVYTQALMHFNFCKAMICDFCAITAFGKGDERSNKTVFEVRDGFKFLFTSHHT